MRRLGAAFATLLLLLCACDATKRPKIQEVTQQPQFKNAAQYTGEWLALLDERSPYGNKWRGRKQTPQIVGAGAKQTCEGQTVSGDSVAATDIIAWCPTQGILVVSETAMGTGAEHDIDGVVAAIIIQYAGIIQGQMNPDCVRGGLAKALTADSWPNLSKAQVQRLKDWRLDSDSARASAEWERGYNDPQSCKNQ